MKPIVYIKPGCPWCVDALNYFKRNGLEVETRNVLADREAMERLLKISGKNKTPTLEYGDFVCADFAVDELLAALDDAPEVKEQLGLRD
ncbi:MAG: glutaredoxin family protein [Verrucomicrobiota bacterium JB022]|nr:glutaredoxin family protein [Verrucomicrobiota bacterium JB022]